MVLSAIGKVRWRSTTGVALGMLALVLVGVDARVATLPL
jgi:hypothetical protein